jgi:YbbR domain-containing protein
MERKAGQMKKFQEMITKDLGWKLLSVVIAVVLWFMVINLEHPIESRSYTQSIVFENIDSLTNQGLTLRNPDELENLKITIKVKAQRTELDRLNQHKHQIKAWIDLGNIVNAQGGMVVNLPVQVKLPESAGTGFEIISRTPSILTVSLERLISVQKTIEPEFTGTTAQGYVLTDISLSPETVQVTGPEYLINQITAVKANINSTELQESTATTVVPLAYDAQGNVINKVQISPAQVTASLGVYHMDTLSLFASTNGEVRQGYVVEKISCSPSTVEIIGSKEALSQYKQMVLPPIDITDATRTVVKTFSLRNLLPDGILLKSDNSGLVQVTIEVNPESKKQWKIPVDNIVLTGKNTELYEYHFEQDTFTLEAAGSAAQINAVSPEKLTAVVNVSNVSLGRHTLQIAVDLPEGIRISGAIPETTITISERKQTENPDSSSSQTQDTENEP